jgi:hypothetical protein
MKPGVDILIPSVLSIFTFLIILLFQWICLLNIAVSLANALNRTSALEAKLKATTKALEEADKSMLKKLQLPNLLPISS